MQAFLSQRPGIYFGQKKLINWLKTNQETQFLLKTYLGLRIRVYFIRSRSNISKTFLDLSSDPETDFLDTNLTKDYSFLPGLWIRVRFIRIRSSISKTVWIRKLESLDKSML
jgi:hypothetical protein